MISRLTGAVFRAILVVILISTPSLLLPQSGPDSNQIVVLIALFAAGLTLFEYASTYPGLVEFRDAPPFNRVRFISLFVTVFLLSAICRGKFDPTALTQFLSAIGALIGHVIDFPYSPVRLVLTVLPDSATPAQTAMVRTAAGIAYLSSLLSLAAFLIALRLGRWPTANGDFNVWINLPTFDPTAGGDVVDRLRRDARFNVVLGFLLPFLIPAVVSSAAELFNPISLETPQTLIWTVTAWAFLPASLFMRGIAMGRVADMICEKRRQTYAEAQEAGLLPA